MNCFEPMATRRVLRLPTLALAVAAAAAAMAVAPAGAGAADVAICLGSAKLGESRADAEVAYRIACNIEVRGFSIVALDRQVDSFDTEPVVLDDADNPKLGEDFTCSGLIPGFGVSCAGKAGIWSRVNGHISLTSDPCKGPRPRFGFTVADGKGVTAGPFRLMSAKAGPAGRPLTGCPATATRKKPARRTARH